MKYDVLIIGAGAAGLMAMKTLTKAGYQVCMLEAGEKAGGRVAIIEGNGFSEPMEAGPEFIHGNLELTMQLVKEAGLVPQPAEGKMIPVINGNWITQDPSDQYWEEFMNRLQQLEEDITIENLLQQYFAAEKYAALRDSVRGYAEGFDLADVSKASSLFVREEWSQHYEAQYRIKGGYGKLISYLEDQCIRQKAVIHFNQPVYRIEHGKNYVTAYTKSGVGFAASKLIVAVPLGVLQNGSIKFIPVITEQQAAIQQLGFGPVIKLLLEFKTNFWKSYADDLGFILSDEIIPTWWTQFPKESNLLTGWLGGPPAITMSRLTGDDLLQKAFESLANIFSKDQAELKEQLVQHKIVCWNKEPYILGGYSYITLASSYAKTILEQPINDCIFFAGEAYYTGPSQGTVEAALQNGLEVAQKLQQFL